MGALSAHAGSVVDNETEYGVPSFVKRMYSPALMCWLCMWQVQSYPYVLALYVAAVCLEATNACL